MDSLHPSESKKNARNEGAAIVYEDEASFRQTRTLYRTWARRGQQPQIPTRGERHTQKILGAVSVPTGDFVWRHQEEYFNAETYLSFVDGVLLPHYYRRRRRVYLIQDNASFHKKPGVLEFFAKHSRQIEVFSLPLILLISTPRNVSGITPGRKAPTTGTSIDPPRCASRCSRPLPKCKDTRKKSADCWCHFFKSTHVVLLIRGHANV